MGPDITCVAISFRDQLSIRRAAVVEYDSEGNGVLKDGGWGSCNEAAGGVGVLVAQAVRDTAQMVSFSAQKRFTGAGFIEDSLVLVVDGFLRTARQLGSLQGLLPGISRVLGALRVQAGNLAFVAPCLCLPARTEGQRASNNRCGCVGVEAGDHRQPFHQVSIM